MARNLDLLYVYDATVSALEDRNDADFTVRVKGGGFVMSQEFDKIIAQGMTYKRAVVTCHGKPGVIRFDGNDIDSKRLKELFENKGYDKMFPGKTRIYFNGCNVGDEEIGLEFLETAGSIFLKRGGGEVFAMDNKGVFFDKVVSGLTLPWGGWMHGHVAHPFGTIRSVQVYPGGVVVRDTPPAPTIWSSGPRNPRETGNKI